MTKQIDGRGWKFLNSYNATTYNGIDFVYPVPGPDEKWGPWCAHPDPAQPDGKDCGFGRLHVMNKLDARYAPTPWWPWFVEYRGVIGKSEEKTGVRELRLRRVPRRVFWKIIRMGYLRWADLSGVILRGADLREADLRGADLSGADLREANLRDADLRGAKLRGADLRGADLRGADLREADLSGANLSGADLSGADLSGVNLREADLRWADLREAVIIFAIMTDEQRKLFEGIKA